MNIYVAGGFDTNDPNALNVSVDDIREFASKLGAEIITQGHNLITGAQTELDQIIALSALECAKTSGQGSGGNLERVISYIRSGVTPVFNGGIQIKSDVNDWDFGGLEPTPPEVISMADVIILVGGFFGTFQAANWARTTHKPILPFAVFGGASKEVYGIEAKRFQESYGDNIRKIDYDQVLKSATADYAQLATNAVSLAERIVTNPAVFVVMSFAEIGQFKDLYKSIQRVCKQFDYNARRVDDINTFRRIIPEIMRGIRQSAFVIVDVTDPKPNVFYELGVADGLRKEVIVTAKKGTQLPFNINDVPVLFWDSFADFEEALVERVKQIGKWQGRS